MIREEHTVRNTEQSSALITTATPKTADHVEKDM
eukprot:jgi/Botrbrau1/21950/Bobra.0249s0073.1